MFTGTTSVIEASWGIGERIVAGHITPDSWHVSDPGIIERRPGVKTERSDRSGVACAISGPARSSTLPTSFCRSI